MEMPTVFSKLTINGGLQMFSQQACPNLPDSILPNQPALPYRDPQIMGWLSQALTLSLRFFSSFPEQFLPGTN
jgi:hypothetical protein